MTFAESNWHYDSLGRVVSQVVQEGPGASQVARQDITYSGADDVMSLDNWLGASNHKHFTYGFDLRHQLISVGETQLPSAFTASYSYNSAGRFVGATEASAALPNGNVRPRQVTYNYDGQDPEQVTALTNVAGGATAWAYSYDAAGNQTIRCSGPIVGGTCNGADETDYLYDGDDKLRRATRKLSGVVQGREDYWYDGSGNRNIVVKRGPNGLIAETLWFINDVESHYDSDGHWTHSYAHVSMETPVARVDTDNASSRSVELQFHGLAESTLATVDQSTGTINASFDYAPFGEVVEATDAGGVSAGVATHLRRINDKFTDNISALTYYGARYFDQTSLTWTQGDPLYRFIPEAAGIRPRRALLYTSDLNNPLKYTDPDGRQVDKKFAMDGGVIDVEKTVEGIADTAYIAFTAGGESELNGGPRITMWQAAKNLVVVGAGIAAGDAIAGALADGAGPGFATVVSRSERDIPRIFGRDASGKIHLNEDRLFPDSVPNGLTKEELRVQVAELKASIAQREREQTMFGGDARPGMDAEQAAKAVAHRLQILKEQIYLRKVSQKLRKEESVRERFYETPAPADANGDGHVSDAEESEWSREQNR